VRVFAGWACKHVWKYWPRIDPHSPPCQFLFSQCVLGGSLLYPSTDENCSPKCNLDSYKFVAKMLLNASDCMHSFQKFHRIIGNHASRLSGKGKEMKEGKKGGNERMGERFCLLFVHEILDTPSVSHHHRFSTEPLAVASLIGQLRDTWPELETRPDISLMALSRHVRQQKQQ